MDDKPLTSALDRRCGAADQVVRRPAALGWALAWAFLELAACGRAPPAPTETRIPPGLEERFYPPPSWTWGALDAGGAHLRYGVAPPTKAVRAEVLILPDAGEPAEAWFETANNLIARNCGVWVLDLAGQGGSARAPLMGERLRAASLDGDVTALEAMVNQVVRPRSRAPLILVGDGLGAQLALRALSDPPSGVTGAVLGAPALSDRPDRLPGPLGALTAQIAQRIGLGFLFAEGQHEWRGSTARPQTRVDVAGAWMQTNSQLRIGGASLSWTAAFDRSAAAARDPALLHMAKTPVLMATDAADTAAHDVCTALPACRFLGVKAPAPHLAPDAARGPWLEAVAAFIQERAQGHSVAAAPVRGQ